MRSHLSLFSCLFLIVCLAATTWAQQLESPTDTVVPTLVSFSGTVRDINGKPSTEIVGVTFSLYQESEGGAPLWVETQNVQPDNTGHYSVMLGSTTSQGLPADLFASGEARWLGVRVAGQEEQSRVLLLSVPYALKAADAQTLGGLPASAFALAATPAAAKTTGTGSANSTSSAQPLTLPAAAKDVTTTGGTAQHLPMFTSATNIQNSIVQQISTTALDVAGKLGVNTAAPSQSLDVTSGNAIVRGVGNFTAKGDTATLWIGDTSHPIEAIWNSGLAVGTYKAPQALFIHDQTGYVGIGKTNPAVALDVNGAGNFSRGVMGASGTGNAIVGVSSVAGPYAGVSGSGLFGVAGVQTTPCFNACETGGAGGMFSGYGGAPEVNGYPGVVAYGGNGGGVPAFGSTNGGDGVDGYGGATQFGSSGVGVAGFGGSGEGDGDGAAGIEGTGGLGTINVFSDGQGGTFQGANSGTGEQGGGDGVDGIAGSGYAGNFTGNLNVSGAITAGTKDFKIDHPLDPANKYLVHASVESSEMKNIYDGVVTTDARGVATVHLPEWFEALNRDFRYQLTVIGEFAQAIIGREIQDHQFTIRTTAPNVKVSWQVTGVRQDPYAKAHPLTVEEKKEARLRGFYIHPELYGAPEEKQIEWGRHPQTMKRLKEAREKQASRVEVRAAMADESAQP
jgi:trimeric autotransporter adhesin